MSDVTITPSENGPYLVSGPVHLTDVDGREIEHPDQMALCRCGHSGAAGRRPPVRRLTCHPSRRNPATTPAISAGRSRRNR
jgi:Iron-binding zinc finger CDGSH type